MPSVSLSDVLWQIFHDTKVRDSFWIEKKNVSDLIQTGFRLLKVSDNEIISHF